ncbi:MAG: aminotransferase class V-fold PLP-dependent enzyme [Burkholderiales bacterium]
MNDPRPPVDAFTHARAQFPGASEVIYLENSARCLLPAAARDAALAYYETRMRGAAKEHGGVFDAAETTRGKVARLLHAEADEVTLTRNVSEGLNILTASLPWQRGDNAIVCTEIEHPNGVYTLYNMRDRHGIDVKVVSPAEDMSIPAEAIIASMDARTRLVIVSSVTFSTGARTDLARLGAACRSRGIVLLVDGAQSVGVLELDVHAAQIDALAVGASKYLCGPYGLGFLFVRRALAEQLRPAYLGRFSVDLGDAHEGEKGGEDYRLMPGARRFDLGSGNYSSANAVGASLDILLDVGVPAIERHVMALSRALDAGLREHGIPLVSGMVEAHRSHLVLAGLRRPSPRAAAGIQSLAGHLARNNIRASLRQGRLRFSHHLYNTPEEIQTVLASVRDWARQADLTTLRESA